MPQHGNTRNKFLEECFFLMDTGIVGERRTFDMLLQHSRPRKTKSLIDVKIKDHGEDYRVTYKLNTKQINKLMMESGAANMKIVVVSVSGKARSGKSFILDFFLRYAKHKYVYHKPNRGWLGSAQSPLQEGFSWSHSARESDTVGVEVWPQLFTTVVKGQKVCIVLMDTQGSHDNESTWQEMSGVFALSTLASSLQIYNVRNRIDDTDLSHLEKFCTHASAFAKSGSKPYQKILFLVRDWGAYNFHEYGYEGGYNYLKETVFREVKEAERLKTRHNIRAYFNDMACFLMPDPGEAAKGKLGFAGHLTDLDDKFIQQLDTFVPSVLAAENLELKKVDGQLVTAEQLFQFLQFWVERFNSINISAMTVMVTTTTEVVRLQVKNEALEQYIDHMDEFCKSRLHFSQEQLFKRHISSKEQALNYFNREAILAGEAVIQVKYKQSLLEDIELKYVEYKSQNSHKMFQRDQVVYLPCVAVPIMAVCWIIDQNKWMKKGTHQYWITITVFWAAAAVMGYWVMVVYSWLATGCSRCAFNTLFWIYMAVQVYNHLVEHKNPWRIL